MSGTSWIRQPAHRQWLAQQATSLVEFAARGEHPDGGFAWQNADGSPDLSRPRELWITTRMVHCLGLGHAWGQPGLWGQLRSGVEALRTDFHDTEHGGWFSSLEGQTPVLSDKRGYEHAFVVLASATALHAGVPGAADLLTDALAIQERHFWDETQGLVVDVWDRTWTDCEPYRGINANMHTVEAYLAAADAGADPVWRRRALRIAERVIHGWARDNAWRIPEHFDPAWQPLPEYNRVDPGHPFRPYGATIGHALEWSRLLVNLHAGLMAVPGGGAPDWLIADAQALFETAVADGWASDGADGFVYTTDWDGKPVVRQRLFWVVAEGIAAAAALADATGSARYEPWYRLWWDYAARYLIDPERGGWQHELDPQNRPADTIWAGKPDTYHALQACLLPQLPLAPTLAAAVASGQLR